MTSPSFCLIGLGKTFSAIAADPDGHQLPEGWITRRVESVSVISSSVIALLEGLDQKSSIFIAVDENALNFARLELYGAARLRGLRMATLVHRRAVVAPTAKISDNCWIGAGAIVNDGAHVSGDVLMNPGSRLDAGARIGMHAWIGGGAVVGSMASIGAHSVIGDDVKIRSGTTVGKYCVIDTAQPLQKNLTTGNFIAPYFDLGAQIIGSGYTLEKLRR